MRDESEGGVLVVVVLAVCAGMATGAGAQSCMR